MRGLRSTLFLLVVLLGLGGYIYFGGAKKDDADTKKDRLFPSIEAAKIEEMTVKSESGDTTTLKKDNGTWNLLKPLAVPASESDATGITNALADIDVARVLDEAPTDVKGYGLDPAKIDIEFKSSDGKVAGHLLIGDK